MVKRLALVMSGGGARGALQAGAVRALLEAGYIPDVLIGTSIGAINSAMLGLHGVDEDGLRRLAFMYSDGAELGILSNNFLPLALRALVRRPDIQVQQRIREFYIKHGITPELRFGELSKARVRVVATDLNNYKPVIYGRKSTDLVLDGLIASSAVPPWVPPIEQDGQLLLDGAVVSNLPIETALETRPRLIIGLDVREYRDIPGESDQIWPFINKLVNTVQKRQLELELALAAASRTPVHYIHLFAESPVSMNSFDRWEELIERGYLQARKEIGRWSIERPRRWSPGHRR